MHDYYNRSSLIIWSSENSYSIFTLNVQTFRNDSTILIYLREFPFFYFKKIIVPYFVVSFFDINKDDSNLFSFIRIYDQLVYKFGSLEKNQMAWFKSKLFIFDFSS